MENGRRVKEREHAVLQLIDEIWSEFGVNLYIPRNKLGCYRISSDKITGTPAIQLLAGVETSAETTKGIWKQFQLGRW